MRLSIEARSGHVLAVYDPEVQIVSGARSPVARSSLGAGAIAAGASVPALLAVLPLTLGSIWYVAADENREFLTTGRAVWGLVLFSTGLLPFIAFAVALVTARVSGSSWAAALNLAAVWLGGLGLVACGAAVLGAGGF